MRVTGRGGRSRVRLPGVCLLAVLAASCSSAATSSSSSSSSSASSGPRATTADGCALPAGGRVVSWSSGGRQLQAVTVPGDGATALVVSNSSDQTLCDWLPYLALLRPHGTVWLYDYALGGTGVDDVRAVVDRATAAGARRVVLVGASKGAKASLVAAARLPSSTPVAVVALSPEATLADGTPVLGKIRKARYPTLIVTAKDDPYQAAPAGRAYAKARPAVTTLVTVDGDAHGTALLTGPTAGRVRSAVTAFLAKHA